MGHEEHAELPGRTTWSHCLKAPTLKKMSTPMKTMVVYVDEALDASTDGTKPIYIDKAVNAVEGTDSVHIYDTDIGRPIWREARECMLSSLNEVGGGLADYIVQRAIDAEKPLAVVDGFGGRKGYNLELIDTDTGPIRDRIYKIIKASLHTKSLWLPQLKLIYMI
jgi:hypothetical protein